MICSASDSSRRVNLNLALHKHETRFLLLLLFLVIQTFSSNWRHVHRGLNLNATRRHGCLRTWYHLKLLAAMNNWRDSSVTVKRKFLLFLAYLRNVHRLDFLWIDMTECWIATAAIIASFLKRTFGELSNYISICLKRLFVWKKKSFCMLLQFWALFTLPEKKKRQI